MMNRIMFFDTNALLHSLEDCVKLVSESGDGKIYLSSVTLRELEDIKTSGRKDDAVKFAARRATRFIAENEDMFEVCNVMDKHIKTVSRAKLEPTNDNLIIACAVHMSKKHDVTFVTNDMCCLNTARSVFGLNSKRIDDKSKEDYKGYVEVTLSEGEYNTIYSQYENGKNVHKLIENQYLIINLPDSTIEYRYRYGMLCPLELPKKIKGLSAKQRCAIDLLNDTTVPIKVIAGVYGSGKTYLAARVGLYHLNEKGNYSKIMLVRNPTGSGEDIGFLPGTQEEKTADFYTPFVDNLHGGEQELNQLKMQGKIETQIPFFMKGRSIPCTYIIVDEAEDLTTKDFKLIGSRIARESCIVFTGDWRQAESKYKHNNGLSNFIKYVSENPNELVGVMVLDDDVRSEGSKYFANFE